MNAITINLNSIKMTDEQFYELCQNNRDLRFERNVEGKLIIMAPTGGGTGKRNFDLNLQLGKWNEQKQLGICFDSSTGFKLPNGADRSADVAWIPVNKWNNLTQEQQEKFLPLCPDFVIELRSPSDDLKTLQDKMTSDPASAKDANASSFKSGNPFSICSWGKPPRPQCFTNGLARERARMQEYLDNGTRLGWLINRKNRQVEVYRQGQVKEILNNPDSLSGEDVLTDFSLKLESIW